MTNAWIESNVNGRPAPEQHRSKRQPGKGGTAGAAVDRASHRPPRDHATASAARVTNTMIASRITVPTMTAV